MPHRHFKHLLSLASVTSHDGKPLTNAEKENPVRVQWDPERSPAIEALPYRSIQIGISGAISEQWAREWIESIEDVTEKATALKTAVQVVAWNQEELMRRELLPNERKYPVEPDLCKVLGMDLSESSDSPNGTQ